MNKEMMRESIGGACTEATEAGAKLGSGPEIWAHCGMGDGAEPGLGLGWEEPWPEAVDGQELLGGLEQLLRRFVVLPKWAAETSALWVLHTYAFELRDVSTYLGIESPEKRCGKTTLLTVLSELVNRPVVAANISSPAFFRVIEEARPTLLIDEGDTFLRGNDDLRGILNCGGEGMWKKISGRCFEGTFRCLKCRNCGRNWLGEGAIRVLRGPEAPSRAVIAGGWLPQ